MSEPLVDDKCNDKDPSHRVKLYVLNEKRVWDDKGTGHVTCVFNERLQSHTLTVRSEQDGSILLESKILNETAYQKQQETLIVWTEADNSDFALSFQEKQGCDEVWRGICGAQGRDPAQESSDDTTQDSGSDEDSVENGALNTVNSPTLQLPPCDLIHLKEINDVIAASFSAVSRRDALAFAIDGQQYVYAILLLFRRMFVLFCRYIPKLIKLFHMVEDLEDLESLHLLYRIFKNIFFLNKPPLFETLLSEQFLFDVIGILEYDPTMQTRRKHREFLWEQAKFKEVVPINSVPLLSKIHQVYRVQYIYDFIFPAPSIFEENVLSTLSSFIFFTRVEIINMLQEDKTFLATLFALIKKKEATVEEFQNVIGLLKEFCSYSPLLQAVHRESFFRVCYEFFILCNTTTLMNNGILDALEFFFQCDDSVVRSMAVDILNLIVDFDAPAVRNYCIIESSATEEKLFLNLVIDLMNRDPDPDLVTTMHAYVVLKNLIDPETMPTATAQQRNDKHEFLSLFYRCCVPQIFARFFPSINGNKLIKDSYRNANLTNVYLELLTFCIEHHSYHVRSLVLSRDLVAKILVFLQSRHMFLKLSALRFFRKIVHHRDDFYNRHIIRHRLFDPVVKCFIANGSKYNVLNSALIELFEFIRTENVRILCLHFVENYMEHFEDVTYVNTFQGLKRRYEQQDSLSMKSSSHSSSGSLTDSASWRRIRNSRELDEEEQWLNDDDEDEWNSNGGTLNAEQPRSSVISYPIGSKSSEGFTVTQPPGANAASSTAYSVDNGSEVNLPPLRSCDDDDDDDGIFFGPVKPKPKPHKIVIHSSSLAARLNAGENVHKETVAAVRALVDYNDSDSDEEMDHQHQHDRDQFKGIDSGSAATAEEAKHDDSVESSSSSEQDLDLNSTPTKKARFQ
ncbi:Serine/threonine-protein phosphatase 4 regulatory subunit 3A [Trichinella sp. T8]|nr:Serine/threonine-protein phosphatase 4 regulatory subunit 3A [Trichinella sp. T8]